VGKAGEVGWSAWRPVAGLPPLQPAVLAEILDGGQAFRWHQDLDGVWTGVWSEHVAQLRFGAAGAVEWRAPPTIAPRVATALRSYLGLDADFPAQTDALPWRSDPHLARCVAEFPGLRLLRQPFGETLLGFLCSATKQIVQIKQMVALLAERHGTPIVAARVSVSSGRESGPASATINRLPTWPEIARIPETELRACLLGFRARYIAETARFLAAQPGWLEATETLPYPAAKERLCELPGVGEKVADCVLLFGAGRLEAFPVDVWILKTLARRYGLDGWKPAPLAQFGRAHFGRCAGLAQQFLFAWERRRGRTSDDTGDRKPDTE
jgi:N-glycosylase/DNA lyase